MDLSGVKEFVIGYLQEKLGPAFHYHDLAHTLDVYESVKRIASLEGVDPNVVTLLEAAALFHDTGMTEKYDDHETVSANLCRTILPGFGFDLDAIDRVCRLIMATKPPTGPVSLEEQIMCDADLDYLGRGDFFMRSFQLKEEWEQLGIGKYDPVEWLKTETDFLRKHNYYTETSRSTRGPGKAMNLEYLELFLTSTGN
jgi:uncharacterized protein